MITCHLITTGTEKLEKKIVTMGETADFNNFVKYMPERGCFDQITMSVDEHEII